MTRRQLLTVMAVIEWGAGLALLVAPALVSRLLFGDPAVAVPMIALRLLGLGLIGLGVMCWRGDAGRSFRIMLGYNALAALALTFIGLVKVSVGVLLWPAVVLHAGLALVQIRDIWRGDSDS
jgi:hypothetical protein